MTYSPPSKRRLAVTRNNSSPAAASTHSSPVSQAAPTPQRGIYSALVSSGTGSKHICTKGSVVDAKHESSGARRDGVSPSPRDAQQESALSESGRDGISRCVSGGGQSRGVGCTYWTSWRVRTILCEGGGWGHSGMTSMDHLTRLSRPRLFPV